jgi:hypothetical protein
MLGAVVGHRRGVLGRCWRLVGDGFDPGSSSRRSRRPGSMNSIGKSSLVSSASLQPPLSAARYRST